MTKRIEVLLACNADGTGKLLLLVTGKSKNLHCFKNVRNLPTEYVAHVLTSYTVYIYGLFQGITFQRQYPKDKDFTFH
jgi:hypothetical protein